jgi:hypothetical protein
MNAEDPQPASETAPPDARTARRIVRAAMKASLATLEAPSGAPYASLVAVATTPACRPIIAISALSHHHANIAADARVSLLFDGTPASGDPLESGRVTVSGRAVASSDDDVRSRYMARHPGAFYTGFGDFGFFEVEVEKVHFVAGFGRVRWFKGRDFIASADLAAAEADILAHMNADHGDAVAACATGLLGAPAGAWRLAGIDPEGADLILDGVALRLDFPEPATTPADVRAVLVGLAKEARSG